MLLFNALWAVFSLRLGEFYYPGSEEISWLFIATPFIAIPVFTRFGLYLAIILALRRCALTYLRILSSIMKLWPRICIYGLIPAAGASIQVGGGSGTAWRHDEPTLATRVFILTWHKYNQT